MKTSQLDLIQVPYDSGHLGWRMGAGPLELTHDSFLSELRTQGVETRLVEVRLERTYELDAAVQLHRMVARAVTEARRQHHFPLILSGNCNTAALGVAAAMSEPIGVIWFDAHGDFNTPETSPSGFLDGMALAMMTGRAWAKPLERLEGFTPISEDQVVLVGARSLDPDEERTLHSSAVRHLKPSQVDQIAEAASQLVRSVGRVYLHIDLDVLDPAALVANNYAAPDGLSVEQLISSLRTIVQTVPVMACGITAYDPSLDHERKARNIVSAIVRELMTVSEQ